MFRQFKTMEGDRMEYLSTPQLEAKINNINMTIVTLKIAIKDVMCEKAKKVIQLQINSYTNTLKQLLFERNTRNLKILE